MEETMASELAPILVPVMNFYSWPVATLCKSPLSSVNPHSALEHVLGLFPATFLVSLGWQAVVALYSPLERKGRLEAPPAARPPAALERMPHLSRTAA